ncbi:MAG: ParB N-terminal domain-containing protein [Desulfobacterales bacterium]|nr:ParB N-terminal domain-containing protein [Deltaproteobacteria bacterium]MBT8361824.1 ParB N-terminal domain-containing protein [Deltaproteobacteria bacterium]NNK92749.1 ParB N-terminal domain-containing protein [Desulfobacterales bacterium]
MKIEIDQIAVDEVLRIRKDSGNLESLQNSIAEVGLINPILIDEKNNLVAGYRRLIACKNLGWKEVEVTIIEIKGDELKMLDVEVAENFFRKDFTPEEIFTIEKRRQEIYEKRRKKGLFERFWNWLKNLFKPTQSPADSPPVTEKQTTEQQETPAAVPAEPPAEQEAEQPQPESAAEGQTAEQQKTAAAAPPEPPTEQKVDKPQPQSAARPKPPPQRTPPKQKSIFPI